MDPRKALGERLRSLRVERGLTQQQVAEPAYSAAYVSTIEAGRRAPSSKALDHFAAKLAVTVEELTTGIPSSFDPEVAMRLQAGWQGVYEGRFDDAEKVFKAVEKDCRRVERPLLRARALVGLAWCAERRGQTADALELFERSVEVLDGAASLPARAEGIAGIARTHQMSGGTRLAAHILETYLLELERQKLRDPRALMRTYASLVWPYMELGLHEKAAEAAEKALRLRVHVDSPEEIAAMHMNVARALLDQDNSEEALDSLRSAQEIYETLNWRTEIARARINRGMVHITRGELAEARTELRIALETFREVGFVRGEARTLNELARLERTLGRLQEATATARRAVELLSEMDAVPELALAHRELALSLRDENPEKAEEHLRKAIDLYKECGESTHAADTHRLLGDLLATRGETEAWAEYRAGLLVIADSLGRKD